MIVTPDAVRIKVVYYGPGGSGKTTTLEKIAESLGGSLPVKLRETSGRTVFFDYLPVEKRMNGKRVLISAYTVAGQVVYASTKKLVLRGADGIVFVADSSAKRLEDNLLTLKELEVFCREVGLDLNYMPLVFQYNKRDLEDALPVEVLEEKLNLGGVDSFESVAHKGVGVVEPFERVVELILSRLPVGGGDV